MIKRSPIVFAVAIILSIYGCKDEPAQQQKTNNKVKSNLPQQKEIPFVIVKQYPHSTSAYTEGLEYIDGYIYESTGRYGKSFLSKNELETGKSIKRVNLEDKYFGEGMTVLNDKIYMLTYKSKTGFVFDKSTFKQLQTFPIYTNEGWGMTNDGKNLIYSDGTPFIYFIDPTTFQEVRKIEVFDKYGPTSQINELEYINGFIYANQYNTDYILKIDPKTGQVIAQADLHPLRYQTGIPAPTTDDQPEVMNGIAYDKANNKIYITGKNWPYLFEVKLDN